MFSNFVLALQVKYGIDRIICTLPRMYQVNTLSCASPSFKSFYDSFSLLNLMLFAACTRRHCCGNWIKHKERVWALFGIRMWFPVLIIAKGLSTALGFLLCAVYMNSGRFDFAYRSVKDFFKCFGDSSVP